MGPYGSLWVPMEQGVSIIKEPLPLNRAYEIRGDPQECKDVGIDIHREKNKIYANLVVLDGGAKPTETDCTNGLKALQDAWDLENDSYKSKRRAEYPKFEDQFDQIYNEGIDAWKASIKAIKDKYPKP